MNQPTMDTHYVCTGECGGISPVAQVCGAAVCSRKGEPLVECRCADGAHAAVAPAKPSDEQQTLPEVD